MNVTTLKRTAQRLEQQASFLVEIANEEEYEHALAFMDELIDDYDNHQILINLLSGSIERWENASPEFSEFNKRVGQGSCE